MVGTQVPVGHEGSQRSEYQHRGFGGDLLEVAEERVRAEGFSRVYVTSAVGTREYYRRRGYERSGTHMAKSLFAGHNP